MAIIYKAKVGYEDFFELANAKREAFEAELEEAKAKAVAEVEAEFAERKAGIDKIFAEVSVEEEIADEPVVEEEAVEQTEQTFSETAEQY